MSGKTKRTIYYVVEFALFLAATAGVVLLCIFFAQSDLDYVLLPFVFLAESLRLPVLVHELGHLLCGLAVGLRPVSFSIGFLTVGKGSVRFSLSEGAGSTVMLPRGGGRVRSRIAFCTAGGALLNFVLGGALLASFFALPLHSALLFFAEFALFLLYEGVCALLPAELPAGKTDGAFLLGLLKKTPDAEVTLRVMTAQGALYKKTYSELPHELLFDVPVVREDSAAFLALLQLRYRALVSAEDPAAVSEILRLQSLFEYLPAASRGEVAADLVCAGCLFAEMGEWGQKYEEEARGDGIREVALYARERTAENAEKARAAIGGIKMYGERKYLETLLSLLEKQKHPSETDAE